MNYCCTNSSDRYKKWTISPNGNSAINEDGDTLSIRVKVEVLRTRKRDGREFLDGTFPTYPKAAKHLAYIVDVESAEATK